jgi:hypothetical protein
MSLGIVHDDVIEYLKVLIENAKHDGKQKEEKIYKKEINKY